MCWELTSFKAFFMAQVSLPRALGPHSFHGQKIEIQAIEAHIFSVGLMGLRGLKNKDKKDKVLLQMDYFFIILHYIIIYANKKLKP